MYLAGGRRAPNVDVKEDSEGPGMGSLGSKVAPGRGKTSWSAILVSTAVVDLKMRVVLLFMCTQ